MTVPVIDLANFPAELEKLAAAATEFGCFRVVKHSMPPGLAAKMKEIARSLYEIPEKIKLRNSNDVLYNGGYVPPKMVSNLFESFGIYDAASSADVRSFCSIVQVTEDQREIICDYVARLHAIIVNIAGKVAESLGLVGYSFEDWTCTSRLNHYNFTVEEDVGSVGMRGHTDSNFLTLLQEDDSAGGLEIMNEKGNFVTVDPVPDTYLLFFGDAAKAWSNGRLRTVNHRVICKAAMPRTSVLFSLLAPKDDKIEPVPALIDSRHPRLYRPFMYGEYRTFRNTHGLLTDDTGLSHYKTEEPEA